MSSRMFSLKSIVIFVLSLNAIVSGFSPNSLKTMKSTRCASLSMTGSKTLSAATILGASLAILSTPDMALADSTTQVIQVAKPALDLFINVMNLFFLGRTVISWYPKTNKDAFPVNVIYWPTEPLLQPVRQLVPPAFGVDISSIVWIMLLSFLREILTGPQGVLSLMERV